MDMCSSNQLMEAVSLWKKVWVEFLMMQEKVSLEGYSSDYFETDG